MPTSDFFEVETSLVFDCSCLNLSKVVPSSTWTMRSVAVHSASGGLIRIPYKLSIPVKKIKGANESENVNNPSHKYIEIITEDDFEFWFMGFVRYEKAMMNLETAISMSR